MGAMSSAEAPRPGAESVVVAATAAMGSKEYSFGSQRQKLNSFVPYSYRNDSFSSKIWSGVSSILWYDRYTG